jgi:hypothetical protein
MPLDGRRARRARRAARDRPAGMRRRPTAHPHDAANGTGLGETREGRRVRSVQSVARPIRTAAGAGAAARAWWRKRGANDFCRSARP